MAVALCPATTDSTGIFDLKILAVQNSNQGIAALAQMRPSAVRGPEAGVL